MASPVALARGFGPPFSWMAGKPLKRDCEGAATTQLERSTDDSGTMPSEELSPANANALVAAMVPAGR